MSDTLIATLGGIAGMFGWGASDWLAARSSKKYGSTESYLAIQAPGLVIMALVFLFVPQVWPAASVMLQIGLIGIMFSLAYLLLIKALATGSVGIVSPLVSSYPLATLTLVIAFGDNIFSAIQITSMLFIIIGVVMLAYQKNIDKIPLKVLHKETMLALASAVAWGISFFISDSAIKHASWEVILGTVDLIMVIFALLLLFWELKSKAPKAIKLAAKNKLGIASGVIVTAGSISFYASSEKTGGVLIPAVIASASPLVASTLGAIYDNERLNWVKRLGAVVVVAGIILLNIV